MRIKICKQLARRVRQIDCDEEPFTHGFATLIVESGIVESGTIKSDVTM
jgi:hypothetical protein